MLPFKEISRAQDDAFGGGDAFSCFLPSNDDFDLSEEDKKRLQGLTVPIPENEAKRLQVLRQTKLLDSDRKDASFDRFTDLAKRFFKVPLALISLVDIERQWFKSTAGELGASETPRNLAFCAYTVLPRSPDVFVVEDSHKDSRFKNNELVTGPPFVRFYAGAALIVDNVKVGSLCLIDHVAHPGFTARDKMNLLDLGAAVSSLIEERRSVALNQNQERAKMMLALMHNLRTPLTALHMAASMLTDESLKNREATPPNPDEPRTLKRKDSMREMSLNELKESVGQLKVLIESSLSLGQIIVDKSTRPPSPTGIRETDTELDAASPAAAEADLETSMNTANNAAIGAVDRAAAGAAGGQHAPPTGPSNICNVLDTLKDARKVLSHHESMMQIKWDVEDTEGHLESGTHVCTHRVMYFVILRSIDLFAATWTKVNAHIRFKRTDKYYDSISRKAKYESGKDIIYGLLHVDFTVWKPKEEDIPMGELDIFSIEQILIDSEGGVRLSDLKVPEDGGLEVDGKKLECWLPCGIVVDKKPDPVIVPDDAANSRSIPTTVDVPVTPTSELADSAAAAAAAAAAGASVGASESKSGDDANSGSAAAAATAPAPAPAAAPPKQLRVILVEDCVSIQKLMSRWLKSKDCVVTIASNGKIGYQYLTKQPFDICFMDFLMPVQLGVDTIKYFAEWMQSSPDNNINSEMLMIGLSANATSSDLDEGFANGMHFFCQKPAETELLSSILHAKRTASSLNEALDMIMTKANPQVHLQGSEEGDENNDEAWDKNKKWKIVTSLKPVKE